MGKPESRNNLQLFWGVVLILAGIGVLYRIPQVMPEIAKMGQFSESTWIIRVSFYIMGIILMGGGTRKVWHQLKQKQVDHPQNHTTDLGE